MFSLGFVGLVFGYIGWQCLFWSITFAQWEWWLPFCIAVFLAMVALSLAWRSLNLAVLVCLGLTSKRLAWRDFKNGIADWLVASRTGFKD
jgi:hypothetical protein